MMMLPMRWAHGNAPLVWVSSWLSKLHLTGFQRVVSPEVIVQGLISIVCLVVTGVVATRIYEAALMAQAADAG